MRQSNTSDHSGNALPRVFADFNYVDTATDGTGRVLLDCDGNQRDLMTTDITLANGMQLILDDGEGLSFLGTIRWDQTWSDKQDWVAEVEWSKPLDE